MGSALIYVDPEAEAFVTVSGGDGDGYSSIYDDNNAEGVGYGCGTSPGSGEIDDRRRCYGFGVGEGIAAGRDHFIGSETESAGRGRGSGDGSGNEDGTGNGSVSSDDWAGLLGLGAFCGKKVYTINNRPTLIDAVHGDHANGRILMGDMTTKECRIAKHGNAFEISEITAE